MISLTHQANQQVQKVLSKRGKGLGIRVGVKTTGCSGLAYVLEYVDLPKSEDIKVECDGCFLFIDPKSCLYLDGMTIDYVRTGLNEGFEFMNPNAKDHCGCGASFTV
jgi:iron-sulfur cluster assembly protein